MIKDATYSGHLMGVPLNVEGPVVYYRKDLFQKCGLAFPKNLTELESAATKLKACEPTITPFVSRGLKPALPFTFSVFLHNMGGQYMKAASRSSAARTTRPLSTSTPSCSRTTARPASSTTASIRFRASTGRARRRWRSSRRTSCTA